jgi:hypothetical protein
MLIVFVKMYTKTIEIMASLRRQGTDLFDCARANVDKAQISVQTH